MTITRPPLVVPFYYRGDDSRPMRVVVTGDNDATVEEPQGSDALGVERWSRVEMEGVDEHGSLEAYPHEWAEMVACALAHYHRESLPNGAGPQEPSDTERSLRGSLACILGGFHDRTPEQFRVDALALIAKVRAMEASRPQGDTDWGITYEGPAAGPTVRLADGSQVEARHGDTFTVKSRPPGGAEPRPQGWAVLDDEDASCCVYGVQAAHMTVWVEGGNLHMSNSDEASGFIAASSKVVRHVLDTASEGPPPPPPPPPPPLDEESEQALDMLGPRPEASRPPGGDEPGLRIKIDGLEVRASNAYRVSLSGFGFDGSSGGSVSGLDVGRVTHVGRVVISSASEGAAPPQPTEQPSNSEAIARDLGKAAAEHLTGPGYTIEPHDGAGGLAFTMTMDNPVEPSGVPADPFYAAYHDDERLLRAIAVIESMWGGRCTPDADAGLRKRVEAVLTEQPKPQAGIEWTTEFVTGWNVAISAMRTMLRAALEVQS